MLAERREARYYPALRTWALAQDGGAEIIPAAATASEELSRDDDDDDDDDADDDADADAAAADPFAAFEEDDEDASPARLPGVREGWELSAGRPAARGRDPDSFQRTLGTRGGAPVSSLYVSRRDRCQNAR